MWGGMIGLIAGFHGGVADEIIMRLVDVLLSAADPHQLDPRPLFAAASPSSWWSS